MFRFSQSDNEEKLITNFFILVIFLNLKFLDHPFSKLRLAMARLICVGKDFLPDRRRSRSPSEMQDSDEETYSTDANYYLDFFAKSHGLQTISLWIQKNEPVVCQDLFSIAHIFTKVI